MALSIRHYIALGFFVFLLLLPGRMSIPPFDRDEPRYMQATAQMLESGNFVDVRFQDKPRYLQPAGIYWLEALAVKLSGQEGRRVAWPYRIPSLMAMTGVVVLTLWMGSTLFGPLAGLVAGFVLSVCVLVMAEGRMATIDSTLLLCVMLAQAALLRARKDQAASRKTPAALTWLYWGALGCGMMLKGPLILIPGLGTPLALLAVERDKSWWRRLHPGWGWLVTLALVLPWCVAIYYISHGAFFEKAVGGNLLGKVASGQEAHGLPPGYYLMVFGVAFWPGAFFAAAAAPFVWQNRSTPAVRFLLCWIVPHWVVFELIATKLPHYVLPTYPAIAILTAGALCAMHRGALPLWPRAGWARALLALYGVVALLVGVALCLAGPVLLWTLEGLLSWRGGLFCGGALALVVAAAILVAWARPLHAVLTAGAGAVLLYLGLFSMVVPNLSTIWLSPRIVRLVHNTRPCPRPVLASASFSEPSLVFLMGTGTRLINEEQAAQFLKNNARCGVVLVEHQKAAVFLRHFEAMAQKPRLLGMVSGLNYSKGKRLELELYGLPAD